MTKLKHEPTLEIRRWDDDWAAFDASSHAFARFSRRTTAADFVRAAAAVGWQSYAGEVRLNAPASRCEVKGCPVWLDRYWSDDRCNATGAMLVLCEHHARELSSLGDDEALARVIPGGRGFFRA